MDKIEYNKYAEELVKRKMMYPGKDVFFIPESGYFHDVFNDIFNFFLRVFLKNISEMGLDKNTFVLYVDDFSVNAFAWKPNGYKLIGINAGIIDTMYRFFEERRELFLKDEIVEFELSSQKLNGHAAYYLMFRYFVLFAFFHELGHIFQTVGNISYYKEDLISAQSPGAAFEQQKKEYDADLFGCIQMMIYIKGDFDQQVAAGEQKKETLVNMASVAIAAMIVYFYQTSIVKNIPIYFKEKSHPHPLVRMTYLLNTVANNLSGLSDKFEVSLEDIYSKTTTIVCTFLDLKEEDLYKEIHDNYEQIKEHIALLEETKKLGGYAFKKFWPNLV